MWPAALYQAKANASNDGNASWNVLTANAENITAELVSEDDLAAAPGKASVNRTAKIGQLRPQAEQTSAGSLNAVLTGSVNKAKANKLPLELECWYRHRLHREDCDSDPDGGRCDHQWPHYRRPTMLPS
ncbi:MAG: hypothetical protein ACLSHU_04235 [Oscillospiraceae bacterium]